MDRGAASGAVAPEERNVISVTGEGRVYADPDMAQIVIGMESRAPTAKEAASKNSGDMNEVMAVLKEMGIAQEDIQTVDYSIRAEMYYPEGEGPRVIGYVVTNAVRVKVRDPALAIDDQDVVHVVWSGEYAPEIFYRKRDASGWSEVEEVFGAFWGDCHFPALDIDSAGQVHAVWYEVWYDEGDPPSVYVVYTIRTASGWSPALRLAEMITDEAGEDGVRVVVENGVVHVVYQNTEDHNLYHIKISD